MKVSSSPAAQRKSHCSKLGSPSPTNDDLYFVLDRQDPKLDTPSSMKKRYRSPVRVREANVSVTTEGNRPMFGEGSQNSVGVSPSPLMVSKGALFIQDQNMSFPAASDLKKEITIQTGKHSSVQSKRKPSTPKSKTKQTQ